MRDGQGLGVQLRSLGTAAEVAACDSAEAGDAGALVSSTSPSGVLHAAGAADKGLLAELEPQMLRWMYAPKATGAWLMHVASAMAPLEACVLFSSVGSALGNIGQANYAAGNACLDTHALSRRGCAVAACSMQWPLVGGAGMGAAAFDAMGERQAAIAGFAGILLDEYAACLSAQLAACVGVGGSVQLVHRSDVREVLRDLADASQARFGELKDAAMMSVRVMSATSTTASGLAQLSLIHI